MGALEMETISGPKVRFLPRSRQKWLNYSFALRFLLFNHLFLIGHHPGGSNSRNDHLNEQRYALSRRLFRELTEKQKIFHR